MGFAQTDILSNYSTPYIVSWRLYSHYTICPYVIYVCLYHHHLLCPPPLWCGRTLGVWPHDGGVVACFGCGRTLGVWLHTDHLV